MTDINKPSTVDGPTPMPLPLRLERRDIPIDPAEPEFKAEIQRAGTPWEEDPVYAGAIGMTMFDLPGSQDNVVAVVVPRKRMKEVGSQALVEIRSGKDGDGRTYRGVVAEGPFYTPNAMPPNSNPIVIMAAQGMPFLPEFHAQIFVEVLHELRDGVPLPPRHRPLPGSPVVLLGAVETAAALGLGGDITLGTAFGHDDLKVNFGSLDKRVLRRHSAIMGTTGAGKSTTVANLVDGLQQVETAVVLIDTDGEYCAIHEPTPDEVMIQALERLGRAPRGIADTVVWVPAGLDPSYPDHPNIRRFSLHFEALSPAMVMAMLDLTDAGRDRFLQAYDIACQLMAELRIFPREGNEKDAKKHRRWDENSRGYPRLTLAFLYDVVRACAARVNHALEAGGTTLPFRPKSPSLREETAQAALIRLVHQTALESHQGAWFKVQGALGRHVRLRIFDRHDRDIRPLDYGELTKPGRVSVIDLGSVGSREMKNLAIAEVLRGIVGQQERAAKEREAAARASASPEQPLQRTVILIEEAHEFLSASRIAQNSEMFEQVTNIARRGRKRGVGLVFITQMPQHLPQDVLGLVNNLIVHKIGSDEVVRRLKSLGGDIGDVMWQRVKGLSPGQALIKLESMPRPLIAAMDPAPCRLLMID
jgi:DNA helicase HerA-like ATPase